MSASPILKQKLDSMSHSNSPANAVPATTEASVDFDTATPVTFASRPDSIKSETLAEDGGNIIANSEKSGATDSAKETARDESRPKFSKSTKWTLLGLFSLGLFIDV